VPLPWQVVQVLALVPGLAPLPWQVSQSSQRDADLRILAAAASSSVISMA
jgi:hypothetical protein